MDMPYGRGAYFYVQGPFHTDAPASLGYQLQYTPREIYRLGISAADSACRQAKGRVFSDLPHPEQEQFLTSLEKGEITLQGPPAAAFFDQLLTNTREGYFADPMYGGNRGMGGWKMIAARRALGRMIDTLLENDRFTVYAFDEIVETPPLAGNSSVG